MTLSDKIGQLSAGEYRTINVRYLKASIKKIKEKIEKVAFGYLLQGLAPNQLSKIIKRKVKKIIDQEMGEGLV